MWKLIRLIPCAFGSHDGSTADIDDLFNMPDGGILPTKCEGCARPILLQKLDADSYTVHIKTHT